ncbi:MAG: HupE/UreJ family protein [Pseudomonadota bacterium]
MNYVDAPPTLGVRTTQAPTTKARTTKAQTMEGNDVNTQLDDMTARGARRGIAASAAFLAVFGAGAALAHGGHMHNDAGPDAFAAAWSHGLLHPLTGVDHVVAALAVGAFAARRGAPAAGAFVGALVVGFTLAALAVALPLVETTVVGSALALAAMAILAKRVAITPAVGALVLFGVYHGYAHAGAGASGSALAYAAGVVAATAIMVAAAAAAVRAATQRLGVQER